MARRGETRDVWALARAVGIDVEDERARFLLTQPEINLRESAELLRRAVQTLHEAFVAGSVEGVRPQRYGARKLYYIRPWDLLVWAVNRREMDRYVDRERAARYAAEDGGALGEQEVA